MNAYEWENLIVAAANNPDKTQLGSLAAHLADCEEAKTILVHKGWGKSGQSINDVVRGVPHARD